MLADGSEYSFVEEDGKYKTLYDVIGTLYGTGSDANSFRVPDLRKKFVEGASGTTGRQLGNNIEAGVPDHNHTFTGSKVNTETVDLSHSHSAKVGGGRNSGDKIWPSDGYPRGNGSGGT